MRTEQRVAALRKQIDHSTVLTMNVAARAMHVSVSTLYRRFSHGDMALSEFERLCYLCDISDVTLYTHPDIWQEHRDAVTLHATLFSEGGRKS